MKKTAVVAIGGNSLIQDKTKTCMYDQMEAVKETCRHLADMVELGWTLVITHGNGPQVGFGLRRCEKSVDELPTMPLEGIGAETQGNIGYMIQQSLYNELHKRGIKREAATVVTQVEVDANDPAFKEPTKPIGSFMDMEEAMRHKEEDGWEVVEDAGRGWRRVVASPLPIDIVEKDTIKAMVDQGRLVVSVGGGGIPVIKNEEGFYEGIAAVIDKDYASALLANLLNADLFLISTAVPQVALNFGQEDQIDLGEVTLAEMKKYYDEGHFAAGSMGPKIDAIIGFMEKGGKEALITSPETIADALAGKTGTRVVK